ncbi:protein NinF [Klebsiella pneumoniae]
MNVSIGNYNGGKMLSPNQIQSYEQQSVYRALCAGCMQKLQEDEHYVCETCANLCRECLQPVKQNGEEKNG